jgi:hypothetical protein
MSDRHNRRSRRLATVLVTAGVAALGLLAGCGGDADTADQPAAGSAAAFADLFVGYSADYDGVETPDALAAESTLVVRGRIARVDEGRILGRSATAPGAGSTVVVVVDVDRVLRGALPGGSKGKVYVELPAPLGRTAAEYDRAAPRQAATALYLDPALTAAHTPIVDPLAGRPAGQPLYQPVSPQGFVIEADDGVVQVIEHTEFAGTTLQRFVPGASRFPFEAARPHHR